MDGGGGEDSLMNSPPKTSLVEASILAILV